MAIRSPSIVTNPSEGRLVVNAATGAFTYTPRGGETTTDQFTFRVSDGKLWSNTASVTVTIEKEKDEKGKDKEDKDKDEKAKKG
jgi:VCBS repeat-containing protein